MLEGDSRVYIHRFYQEEGKVGRGAVTYEREEDCNDEAQEILDF